MDDSGFERFARILSVIIRLISVPAKAGFHSLKLKQLLRNYNNAGFNFCQAICALFPAGQRNFYPKPDKNSAANLI